MSHRESPGIPAQWTPGRTEPRSPGGGVCRQADASSVVQDGTPFPAASLFTAGPLPGRVLTEDWLGDRGLKEGRLCSWPGPARGRLCDPKPVVT